MTTLSRNKRGVIVFAAGLLLVVAGVLFALSRARENGQQKSTAQPAEGRPFAPDSTWNTPLAADAPLDPTSRARTEALAADIKAKSARGMQPWPGVGHTTFYTVARDQPRVSVKLRTGPWGAPLQHVLDAGVPIPDRAVPGAGTDGHMVVWQPSTDTMWELWQARRAGRGWQASWGGAMQSVSKSPGYYTNRSWSGLSPGEGWNWGATASSLPEAAGLVRIAELRAGHIDHAVAVDTAQPCKGAFAWPAQRTDGLDANTATCIPEGARLRIDPRLDVDKLGLSPTARTIAVAAQRYGMIVRDRTFGTFQIDMEGPPDPHHDPYKGPGGIYGGQPSYLILKNFPWDSIQLMRMQVCRKAPCLPPPGDASAGPGSSP
jgi:hypothetical protein